MTEEEFALAYAGFVELHYSSKNGSFFLLASTIEYIQGIGAGITRVGPMAGEEFFEAQETPREVIAKIAAVKRLIADTERMDKTS